MIYLLMVIPIVAIVLFKRRTNWSVKNSRVTYFNDVALMSKSRVADVNCCETCGLIYSNHVEHSRYPCPDCGCQQEKSKAFAKLRATRKGALLRLEVYWELIGEETK